MEIKQLILDKIKQYETIIIYGHLRPDGDCYGSQFGLKEIIKSTYPNKNVYVLGDVSEYVNFVGDIDEVPEEAFEGSLSVVVDTATKERISNDNYLKGKEIIKIDHHIPTESSYYADYHWIDIDKPSCSQMIAEFYNTFSDELKLSYDGALAMYVGIVTDTGRFRYRGVNRHTHEMAGLLLDYGVSVDWVDSKLSTKTLEEVKLRGDMLMNFKTTEEGFAYYLMTKDIMEKYNLTQELASAGVNYLAGIEGYPIWALFVETDEEIRIRLRSGGPEIESLARKYEGGGHQQAAGARLNSFDELDNFLKDVDLHIKEYKKTLKD